YGPASFPVSGAPGATVEVAATFTAPATPGTHRATYQLRGPNGLFGDPFWVEVRVSIATPTQPPPPPLPPPSGPSSWRVPFFSQGDPQWGSARMMTCNLSISGFGCALTSLAMIYGAYGVLHNPRTLNTCLGDDACPLRWSSFNLNSCSGSKVAFSARPAFSYQRLEEELRRGPVIVELSNSSGSQHFVVVIQGRGNDPNNYTAHDPGIRNGANQPLSKVLNFWKTYQNLNLTPHSLRTFNGTAIPASISDTEQILPKPEALSPTAEETITGTVTIYDTTDTTIILELAARSSTSNMIEMRVWTDQRSSDVWQPFSPYVEVPMDAVFFVQFRDAAGNASTVIEASVPIASSNVSSQEVYLPMVVR
ncbi:MAG: NBR1-Ig-like domain-containing protein, partial [Roseiflexaceae bacterium]|nr:NBR1-Ig-like domain-containing protein [Roseiflexaceae bacterium]